MLCAKLRNGLATFFSSDFSSCVLLSEYDHSPRVSFSVLVGCLDLREAFSLILEVPFPSAGGLESSTILLYIEQSPLPTPQRFSRRLIFFRPFSTSSLRVQLLGGMLSFSFLFLGQEELEYSWPFAPAEMVVKEVVVGTAVREAAEMGDWSAREPLCLQ